MTGFEQFLSGSSIEKHHSPLPALFEDASATMSEAVSNNRFELAAAAMAIGIIAVSRGKGANLLKEAFATDSAAAKAGASALETSASNSRSLTLMEASTPGGRILSGNAATESKMLSVSHSGAPAAEQATAGVHSGGTANLEFAAGKVSAPIADSSAAGARSAAEVASHEAGSVRIMSDAHAREMLSEATRYRDVMQSQLAAGMPKSLDLAQVQRVSDAISRLDGPAVNSALNDIFRPNSYLARHRFYGG